MATEAARAVYPMMAASNWWKLRERFQKTIPKSKVDGDFIATTLSADGRRMTAGSAQNNVVKPLQLLGLVNDDGIVNNNLAGAWRTDEDYPEVCREIREAIYPSSLLEALPPPTPDRSEVVRWFMRNAKVGEVAGRKMADTYLLLAEADVTKKNTSKSSSSNGRSASTAKANPGTKRPITEPPTDERVKPPSDNPKREAPTLHIDVQIHISPESSDAQIELIFANMAKYLYGSNSVDD